MISHARSPTACLKATKQFLQQRFSSEVCYKTRRKNRKRTWNQSKMCAVAYKKCPTICDNERQPSLSELQIKRWQVMLFDKCVTVCLGSVFALLFTDNIAYNLPSDSACFVEVLSRSSFPCWAFLRSLAKCRIQLIKTMTLQSGMLKIEEYRQAILHVFYF